MPNVTLSSLPRSAFAKSTQVRANRKGYLLRLAEQYGLKVYQVYIDGPNSFGVRANNEVRYKLCCVDNTSIRVMQIFADRLEAKSEVRRVFVRANDKAGTSQTPCVVIYFRNRSGRSFRK